jgi:hypothetical protein
MDDEFNWFDEILDFLESRKNPIEGILVLMILLPIGIICMVICKVREQKEEDKELEKVETNPKKEPPHKKLYEDEGAPWIHGEW